jgi:hypothetical protein
MRPAQRRPFPIVDFSITHSQPATTEISYRLKLVTIDEELLQEVEAAVDHLGTSRSAFMPEALQQALKQMRIAKLERQHVAGYEQYPVKPGEFDTC